MAVVVLQSTLNTTAVASVLLLVLLCYCLNYLQYMKLSQLVWSVFLLFWLLF